MPKEKTRHDSSAEKFVYAFTITAVSEVTIYLTSLSENYLVTMNGTSVSEGGSYTYNPS